MAITNPEDHTEVNCGPTHHHACACREAYFEERLAALQKTVDFERKMVERESVKLAAANDNLATAKAENERLVDACFKWEKDFAAANERVGRAEEALKSVRDYCQPVLDRGDNLVFAEEIMDMISTGGS